MEVNYPEYPSLLAMPIREGTQEATEATEAIEEEVAKPDFCGYIAGVFCSEWRGESETWCFRRPFHAMTKG